LQKHSLAYYSLGIGAWQFERDLKKAGEYMRKSIDLNSNYAESYYGLGRINHSLGKPGVYKPLFQKYIKLAPDTYNAKDLQRKYSQFLTDKPSNVRPKQEYVDQSLIDSMLRDKRLIFVLAGLLAGLLILRFWQVKRLRNSY